MVEIIKTYRQSVPALRFLGKQYGDEDRVNGGFGKQWGDWFRHGWFAELEKWSRLADFEDSGGYIGLMRYKEGEPFQYWIGLFFPENTPVPNGYAYVDFPPSDLGVAWLRGPEDSIYGREGECAQSCEKQGCRILADEDGAYWFFERYVCPRFTTPDEQGNVILDICHYIEKE